MFARIVVHAPVYKTEAMVHAPKVSPKCTFFISKKSGRFVYKCNLAQYEGNFEPKTCIFKCFHIFEAKITFYGASYKSACSTIRNLSRCTYVRSRFFALKNRAVSYISGCTTMQGKRYIIGVKKVDRMWRKFWKVILLSKLSKCQLTKMNVNQNKRIKKNRKNAAFFTDKVPVFHINTFRRWENTI